MSKWFRNILGLVILVLLLLYIAGNWDKLKPLLSLSLMQILIFYGLWFLVTLISAFVVQLLLKGLKIKTHFWDMVLLNHAAILLNYAPMKFGTLFRANYLKRHYGLSYLAFSAFFLYVTFLMVATAAIIGLAVLLTVYGIDGYENKILATVFLITVIVSFLFLVIPLPIPEGKGRISSILCNFLNSRKQLSQKRKPLFLAAFLLAINFLLAASRIGIIYHSMGQNIHPCGFLVLGSLNFVTLFISLTPGSLGITEMVLGFGALVLGIPWDIGIFAAVIDRAITMSYSFIIGGGCALWLWHKSPADFRKHGAGNLCEK